MGVGFFTRWISGRREDDFRGGGFPVGLPTLLSTMVALAFLSALPYLVHGGLRTFIFFDDTLNVYQNDVVLQGITVNGLRWAFTTFHSANWHPLTWVSHMLDVSLFGTAAWGHHLTNVLLHSLNTALLFLVLVRLTGALWASGLAAAFFGFHPLRVESVAWVAERKDVLSGLFFMLILLAYERYARRGGARRYLWVTILLALGLMAKPMLVTVPFVLLLLDLWPLGRARASAATARGPRLPGGVGRLLLEKAPLLALSAAASAVAILAQRASGTVVELTGLSLSARLANSLLSYVRYLGKTVWPASLAIYYPHPLAMPDLRQVAPAFLLTMLISLAVVLWLRRRPYLAVGWFWFLGMLVPVIGLVQVGEQLLADRYTYLPGVGLAVIVAWGAATGFQSLRRGWLVPAAGSSLVLGAMIVTATIQVGHWRDTETLFRHTLAVTSENWAIRNAFGFYLADQDRGEEAVVHLQEAVRLRPFSINTLFKLGVIFQEMGKYDQSVAYYQETLRLQPKYVLAHDNLGMILYEMGRREEAEFHLGEARRLRLRGEAREPLAL